MSRRNLSLLLYSIENDSDTDRLLKAGLEYSQIAVLIDESIREGFLEVGDKSLKLTAKGREFLQAKDLSTFYKSEWIRPQVESRSKQLRTTDIYIPDKNSALNPGK
mgnify:CR=1 FL=1